MKRAELIEECRQLENSMRTLTCHQRRRLIEVAALLNRAECRTCHKVYDARKARSDYTGYCSAKCQHTKATQLGYRKGKGRSEFLTLDDAEQLGTVFVVK